MVYVITVTELVQQLWIVEAQLVIVILVVANMVNVVSLGSNKATTRSEAARDETSSGGTETAAEKTIGLDTGRAGTVSRMEGMEITINPGKIETPVENNSKPNVDSSTTMVEGF
jgi:hypothetical protein